jgi:TPR repeat protein
MPEILGLDKLRIIGKELVYERLRKHEPLLGGWRIREYVGAGVFGCVFRVEKESLGTMVSAVKVISLSRTKSRRQKSMDTLEASIGKEAEEIVLMYQLSGHTNVVSWQDHEVYSYRGQDSVSADIVVRMDYFPQSLARRIEDGPVPLPETLSILKDCFNGLAHIHDHRIIHRDIKPENIFITDDGVAKIGDFGVSKRLSVSTLAKTFAGTPLYMAPEVMNNPMGDSYDHRADMYSIGLVGYEMLTGMLPFEEECDGDEEEMILKRVSNDTALEGDFPEDIKTFIGRMLSKKPEDRFGDCREVVINLRALIASCGKDESTGKDGTFFGFKKPKTIKSRVIERDVIKEDTKNVSNADSRISHQTPSDPPSPTPVYPAVEQDDAQTNEDSELEEILKSAEKGDAEAQFNLGRMYANGQGVDQSDTEALNWFRKAADQGYAKAQYGLGFMYYNGRSLDQSNANALKWYRKAADQGNAEAQCKIGHMYANGQGVDQSYAEALKWFRKAADQGHANAQCSLGVMYAKGQGVDQSDSEALKWFRKAADQGIVEAQFNLGVMYNNGQGVDQSDTEALNWFRKAADQGYAKAQFNLGVMYENGEGVSQSDVQAQKWYRKAAGQGDSKARERVQETSQDNDKMAGLKLVKGTGILGFLGITREYDRRLNEIATLIASKVKQGSVEIPDGNFDDLQSF